MMRFSVGYRKNRLCVIAIGRQADMPNQNKKEVPEFGTSFLCAPGMGAVYRGKVLSHEGSSSG
ncbi:hypothetical protein HMPREF1015_00695 [Bacillus smithii 7_3_47FAA]|uniref:Uncharacterized protein n=1 Tax=Bacillus smithii 7_3_47FAA TaxID=665952 RepID=G9QMC8_9BACI|nr:hypothetical protein HMPREF1015_00695 [Bacillus smithii 7_3_47FAA]